MKQFLIASLFLASYSCGQTEDTEIESILLNCLIASYAAQQIDIANP